MIEVHAEFPQREVIQANAVVDNEEKTVSEVIISAKPEITGVTASVDNETGTPYVDVTETGTGTDFSFDLAFHNLKGETGQTGATGATGNGIASIVKTSTSGLEDNYTITFTNGTSIVFTVTNGNGIADISKTSTSGLVDTYTITFDNGDTDTFTITNGKDGIDGIDGQAATITVGSTTTGQAGTSASVTNSGTSSAAILDFIIPKGDKGDTGNTGATGNGISSITKTSTSGLVDTYTIDYTNGNDTTFDVTNGKDGTNGQDGAAATIAVGTVSTGEAGSSATVVNSGTSSAAVFDFTIPKGDKGSTGDTGPQGVSVTGVSLISTVGLAKTYRMAFSNSDYFDYVVMDGAAGSTQWGAISGVLSNQTDLKNALDLKYDASNPNGYITGIGSTDVINALGYTPYNSSNPSGYITGINSSMVTTALGYTPYNSTNPNGYTSNVGTVTSVNNTQPDANGNVTISTGSSTDVQINGTSITSGGTANIITNSAYDASSNKIATMSDLPEDEIFIATYGTTTYQEVANAYDNGKQIFCQYLPDAINTSLAPMEYITDTQVQFTTCLRDTSYLYQLNNTNVWNQFHDYFPTLSQWDATVGSSTTPVYINGGNVTSTGLSIASSRFDGQWVQVSSEVQLTSDYTPSTSVYSISLSSYLPSGTANYDVLLFASLFTKTSSGKSIACYLGSDLLPITTTTYRKGILLSQARTRTSSNMTSAGSCILPVGSSKTVYLFAPSGWMDGTINLYMTAYRRIGTNA